MTMVKCSECGKDISDRASICIGCGAPIQYSVQEVGKYDEKEKISDIPIGPGASQEVELTKIRDSVDQDISAHSWTTRIVALAIGCYLSFPIGDHLTGYAIRITPHGFPQLFSVLLGYGITGMIFGMCLWFAFKGPAKLVVKFVPIFLLLCVLVQTFFNFFSNDDLENFSPMRVIGYLLTTNYGFGLFIVIPIVAFTTISHFHWSSLRQRNTAVNMDDSVESKLELAMFGMFERIYRNTSRSQESIVKKQ